MVWTARTLRIARRPFNRQVAHRHLTTLTFQRVVNVIAPFLTLPSGQWTDTAPFGRVPRPGLMTCRSWSPIGVPASRLSVTRGARGLPAPPRSRRRASDRHRVGTRRRLGPHRGDGRPPSDRGDTRRRHHGRRGTSPRLRRGADHRGARPPRGIHPAGGRGGTVR